MMRLFLIFLLMSPLFAGSRVGHFKMSGYHYTTLQELYHLYDSRGESIKFYKDEGNEDLSYLATLILNDTTGGCSSKSIQKGIYLIEEDTLVFYSSWDRSGRAEEAPYGARIQRYKIGKEGHFELLSSEIYIEEHQRFKAKNGAMGFLFDAPKTAAEKAQLAEYVKRMEKIFEGHFVFGDEAKKLIEQVEEALRKKQPAWKN